MNKILTLLLFYVLIGIANISLLSIYIKTSSLPGGDIGMMTILIAVLSLITTGISLTILIIFQLLKKALNYFHGIMLYFLIYIGIIGYEIFDNILKDWNDPHVQLNLWMIVIILILLIISIIVAKQMDKKFNNIGST